MAQIMNIIAPKARLPVNGNLYRGINNLKITQNNKINANNQANSRQTISVCQKKSKGMNRSATP